MLSFLGEVGQHSGGAGEDRDRLHGVGGEAEVEQHGCDRHRDVHRQGLSELCGHRVAKRPRPCDVRTAHTALVGQLEDALGPRVDGRVDGVAEARNLPARLVDRAHDLLRLTVGLEEPGALFGGTQNDRACAEDSGGDGSVQRPWVGRECHARCDVGRHHPVLRDRDEQEIEEEPLILRRLASGQEQVEVLVKLSLPIRSPVRSRPRTSTRSG